MSSFRIFVQSTFLKNLRDNNCKTISEPVRSECSSCMVSVCNIACGPPPPEFKVIDRLSAFLVIHNTNAQL